MDYKSTLNLPRTDFPMKADLVAREPERLKKWEKARLYEKIQAARAQAKEKFVLHDGPPFANGNVHIGTALNKILKDIIIKYKTLRGFSAPYVPGWDCHGLPIEYKVMQELRSELIENILDKKGDLTKDFQKKVIEEPFTKTPLEIRKKCEETALNWIEFADGSGQKEQFQRLGVLGDWDNPYLTLNQEYEAEELRLFANIVEKGFVYRGKKPVYWCIDCRTALAEAEVEYAEHVSPSIYVKFPVVGQPNTFVLIWTTTPWTLPANLAVAFNDKFQYVRVAVGNENYILFRGLLSAVAEKCGWTNYTETPLPVAELAKLEYQHPFIPARKGKAYAADFVTSDTGTGFVHIAPGHGLDDYNLGRQNGLPIYSPVNDNGALVHTNDLPIEQQMPAELLGKSIREKKHGKSDANEAVLALLREKNFLLHPAGPIDYPHSYPHCWRSKTPIIFRAMDQWFIEIDHVLEGTASSVPQNSGQRRSVALQGETFRSIALAEIDRVNWIPDWGVNRIKAAVESRPDWCISRQRFWGVPIPFFYDSAGNPTPDPASQQEQAAEVVRNAAKLFEQNGSNVWFEKSAAELWSLLKPKDWKGAEVVAKSNDTLDVWIDSGSSSRAVLMRRAELYHSAIRNPQSAFDWQADMYLEGSDQHRGWFQSSLLLSLAGNGAAPFKTVLTHGFMVDADREKISKSTSWAFSADDFVNLPSLSSKLTQRADPVSSYLWERMSVATRDALENCHGPISDPVPLQRALEAEFNRIISPGSSFSVGDFVNLPSLSSKLTRRADSVSSYLWSQISSGTQDALANFQGPISNPVPLQTALANEFNRIKRGQLIYDVQRFKGVALRSETQLLLSKDPKGGKALERLNKLLLEDAYPLEMSGNVIYDARRFRGVTLRSETQQLLSQNPQGDSLQQLNRLLLEDAYPLEISRKRKQAQAGYEKPQTAEAYVKKWGADIVRLWVSSQDFRNDIIVSEERISKVAETYRVIRNALRYQLSNLYDFDPAKDSVREDELSLIDRGILSEFSKLETDVMADNGAYYNYEFHLVYQRISQFVAVELSSKYHDWVKDWLYTEPAKSHRRRSTQTTLYRLATGLCQMLAPILAFTADEAWEMIPKTSGSVHESQWARRGSPLMYDDIGKWDWLRMQRERILSKLEKARQEKTIGKALDAKVEIVVPTVQYQLSDKELLQALINVSDLKITDGESDLISVSKANGQKCERCWHRETDIGPEFHPDHPTICGRCLSAILQFKAS